MRLSFGSLALIGVAYLVRESMSVLRRFLVENACTRIDKDLCVRLVAHLMEVDLATLSHEQVGALHGRIHRSVEGYVRFLRITFQDFFPAILSGSFALIDGVLAAAQDRPGDGLRRADLDGPDGLAAHHPEGHPDRPAPDSRGDGRHGRRATRGDRLRPGGPHPPAGGPPGRAGGRASPVEGDPPPLRDVAVRQRQGDQRGALLPGRRRRRRLPVHHRAASSSATW